MRKSNPSEPVVSANAAPSVRKARTKTSTKATGARAAKHSKAVVEEPVTSFEPVVAPVVVPAEPAAFVAQTAAPAPVKSVSHEEIAKLAYCYWADRGYQGGNPQEDWARAEKALTMTATS